jgi:uncharacterized protein YhdP
MTRIRKSLVALVVIVLVVVALRLAAPSVVTSYVNRQLADMGDYRGSVAEVDLALLAGGYTLHELRIVKVSGEQESPFADVPQMDLSLRWRALLKGRAVGEVLMHAPVVNFVQAEDDADKQFGTGVNWPQEVRDLFPFQLDLVRAVDGRLTFRAPGIAAEESLTAENVTLELRNLTNVQELGTASFAAVDLNGRVMGNAPLMLVGEIAPNEALPTFDVDLALENAKLVDVNPWLREFLKADAHAGVFSLYAELAAAEGRFEGYVRPILENPEFFSIDEDTDGPFKKAWEAIVGFGAKLFENRKADQVATQIPLSGELENPDAGLLPALVNLGRNAFVAAFAHSLEGSIDFDDVAPAAECLGEEKEACESEN